MTRQRLSRLLVTVLSGGGASLLDVAPASGTLYDAAADGTYTLTLTQPTSPDPLTRIELRYRVTDADNYWTLYIERNAANTAWDLKWGSVASATASFEVETDGIGTVQALRVTLDGADHEVFSSSDGESFTSRGTVTSATYQTNAKVGSSYTGASGANLITNGDFSAWTGDDPDGWSVISESGTEEVTESVDGARFLAAYVDTPVYNPKLRWSITPNAEYVFMYEIADVTSGVLNIGSTSLIDYDVNFVGSNALRGTTPSTVFQISAVANGENVDITIASASVYEVANLDNETDGPSRLEQS